MVQAALANNKVEVVMVSHQLYLLVIWVLIQLGMPSENFSLNVELLRMLEFPIMMMVGLKDSAMSNSKILQLLKKDLK